MHCVIYYVHLQSGGTLCYAGGSGFPSSVLVMNTRSSSEGITNRMKLTKSLYKFFTQSFFATDLWIMCSHLYFWPPPIWWRHLFCKCCFFRIDAVDTY